MSRAVQGHRRYARPLLLGFLVGVGLLLAPGSALADHPFLETFGSANQPTLAEPEGMAVDRASGDLLVIEAGTGGTGAVSRWKPNGEADEFSALGSNKIEGLSFGLQGEVQIAVDNNNGDIYVPQEGAHAVEIFDSTGAHIGKLTESSEGPLASPCGVAVDPSGNVYVGDFSGHIHRFASPPVNGESTDLPYAENCTLAAGAAASEGFIFPIEFGEHGKLSKLDSSSGEEKYDIAGPTTTDVVDPGTGNLFTAVRTDEHEGVEDEGEVREYDAAGETEAQLLSSIKVASKVTGIAVDETTGRIYVARRKSATIEVWGAVLPEAITGSASVAGTTATLHGAVGAAGASPVSCVFEYVETSAKEFEGAKSVPCSPPGPFTGTAKEAVSAEVSGLPEAFFRYRLVAENEKGGEKQGATRFFSTLRPGLPDGRAYELVSPAQKAGEVIPPDAALATLGGSCEDCLPGMLLRALPMQSAPDGDSVLYEGQPFAGGLSSGPNEYLAGRGATGWGTQGLSEPPFRSGFNQGYQAFSADLSRGVLYQVEPPLSPLAPSREGRSFADLYLREADGSLQPLITAEPPHRDPGAEGANSFQAVYLGASADFSHVVFQANDALTGATASAPPAPEVPETGEECVLPGSGCDLYEWVGGQLGLLNVLPDESAVAGAVLGSGRLQAKNPELEGSAVDHAVSEDGSRIFWTDEESGQLFVRIDGTETRKIEDPGSGLFLTASADGSKALLSDGCLYDVEEEECEDLTLDESEVPQGGFQGILGAAEDLSRVYFVDTKALTGPSKTNQNPLGPEHAEEGKFNLYLWEEGASRFIGQLLKNDNFFAEYGDWRPAQSNRTAQVSADGGYLAFMSEAGLTGYDNMVSGGGGECKLNQKSPACWEVFEYAAGTGKLSCASCNPSGQRPLGPSNLSVIKSNVIHGSVQNFLPRQPGNLSAAGGGRLFFESLDQLSPRDTNGKVSDVYEWEPQGVGSCGREGGCVSLISSGAGANDSMFMDSTPSGDDAFFITRQQLLSSDQNEQLDLYDARAPHTPGEALGFPEEPPAPCGGEACKGPVSPQPSLPPPGSAEFGGPGNPPMEERHKKHKKKHKKRHKGGSK